MALELLAKSGNVTEELAGLNSHTRNMDLDDSLNYLCVTAGSLGCGSIFCNSMGGCC